MNNYFILLVDPTQITDHSGFQTLMEQLKARRILTNDSAWITQGDSSPVDLAASVRKYISLEADPLIARWDQFSLGGAVLPETVRTYLVQVGQKVSAA